jgi:hypothetical protein
MAEIEENKAEVGKSKLRRKFDENCHYYFEASH